MTSKRNDVLIRLIPILIFCHLLIYIIKKREKHYIKLGILKNLTHLIQVVQP